MSPPLTWIDIALRMFRRMLECIDLVWGRMEGLKDLRLILWVSTLCGAVCLSNGLRGNALPCVVPLHALISYSNCCNLHVIYISNER